MREYGHGKSICIFMFLIKKKKKLKKIQGAKI
jgi:hypothetical protein